jgi:hypothetical protein
MISTMHMLVTWILASKEWLSLCGNFFYNKDQRVYLLTCRYLTFTSFTTITCLEHIILIFNQSFTLQELIALTKGRIQ